MEARELRTTFSLRLLLLLALCKINTAALLCAVVSVELPHICHYEREHKTRLDSGTEIDREL